MKRIRRSRAARALSWLLTVALAAPTLRGIVAPQPAQAQQPATPGNVQTVILIDFVNRSGFGGEALARAARDAVNVELASSARFDVLPRDQVTRAANDLGLRPPFDNVALTRIAQSVGASTIITGEVARVWQDPKASPRTVAVGLRLRVQEATRGDTVNGAAEIATARARPGEDDANVIAHEAVRSAATAAVRDLVQYTLPEGIILYTVGNPDSMQILVNRGSRDGVKPGLEMLVLRDAQRVGRIRITRVFPTDSEAEPLENTLGIRPEDRVRAIFPMPEIPATGDVRVESGRRTTNNRTSMRTLAAIGTVLLVGLVISQAARGNNQTVTGVTAEAEIIGTQPAIKITWGNNIWGSGARVMEYHIWRTPDAPYSPTGIPVAALGSATLRYDDGLMAGGFWDGTRSFLRPPYPPDPEGGATAESETPDAGVVGGPRLGTQYIYSVSSVLRTLNTVTDNNGGQTNEFSDVESTPVNSGPATMLPQPQLSSPTESQLNVDVRTLNFTFPSISGADEFVIELTTAANSTFKNKNLIYQIPLLSTAPFVSGVTQTLPSSIDLRTDSGANSVLRRDAAFLAWITGTPGASLPTLVWRVGARNSQDRPGPVHFITQNPKDKDRTFRYIYSVPRSFMPAVLPPDPP